MRRLAFGLQQIEEQQATANHYGAIGGIERRPLVPANVEQQEIGDPVPHRTRSNTFPRAPPRISANAVAVMRSKRGVLHNMTMRATSATAENPISSTVRHSEVDSANNPNAAPRFSECTISKKLRNDNVGIEGPDPGLDDPLRETVDGEHHARQAIHHCAGSRISHGECTRQQVESPLVWIYFSLCHIDQAQLVRFAPSRIHETTWPQNKSSFAAGLLLPPR